MTTILVVDDNGLVNQLLRDTLTAQGYDVLQAHDANAGYQMILQKPIDLIVLDIVLPDVNGVDLCKALRTSPQTRHIPIILITGTASATSDKVKGLQAGADDYITKPFEIDELLERVRAVLRRTDAQAHRAASAPSLQTIPPKSAPPAPAIKPLSGWQAIRMVILSPGELPRELPGMTLFFLVAMVMMLCTGLAFAPGSGTPPILVCLEGGLLWLLLVTSLTVITSLTGLSLRWTEAARLISLAGVPLLLKFAYAALFSGWTTLSPLLFTASPSLFTPFAQEWLQRLDLFELWALMLVALLLRRHSGGPVWKSWSIAILLWLMANIAILGLLRFGGVNS